MGNGGMLRGKISLLAAKTPPDDAKTSIHGRSDPPGMSADDIVYNANGTASYKASNVSREKYNCTGNNTGKNNATSVSNSAGKVVVDSRKVASNVANPRAPSCSLNCSPANANIDGMARI